MNVIFQCLGITGLVFIFYGLLAFAITQANTPVFWTILGLGCAFVLAFIVGFFKSQSQSKQSFKDILQSRNLKIGLGSIIYTVIIIFCVIVVAVLSERHYSYQKDFTKNKVHTLSEQTVNVLNELKDPLTVTAFFDERSEAKPIAKELLGKYKEQSKQLAVSFVDPDKDNIAAQQFGAKDGDIVIQYQGQHHVTKEVSEQGLTQAIMKVNRKVLPTVCFITGHGEMDIDASAEDPRSLSFIKEGLSNDGFTSKTVNLIQGVPPECGITVLAGPTQALTNNEAAALDVFLSKGGKSIWMLDPVTADPSQSKSPISVLPTGVEEVAEKWGIILGKNFLLEKQVQLFAGVQIVLSIRAAEYGDHPVVEPIKKRQTVFNHVRSVQKNPAFKGTAIEIIKSAG
ncbi:MAG: GldG family protein, partial [Bdellovibrionales bacterium]|nr:GldG family protein [Bdellovibrionales bacterium]